MLAVVISLAAATPELHELAIAHGMTTIPVSVREADDLHRALQALLDHGLREVLVTDADGKSIGLLNEADVTRA